MVYGPTNSGKTYTMLGKTKEIDAITRTATTPRRGATPRRMASPGRNSSSQKKIQVRARPGSNQGLKGR